MRKAVTVVPKLKIRHIGVVNMTELYKNMKYWLDYQGYGNHKETFKENKYIERIKGDSKILEISWTAQRNESDYVAYVIKVGFFVLGLTDIEVEVEGRKVKSQKGDIQVYISSELVTDRKNNWNSSIMQYIYENFIAKKRIEDYMIDLYSKTYSFQDEIKVYLNLK